MSQSDQPSTPEPVDPTPIDTGAPDQTEPSIKVEGGKAPLNPTWLIKVGLFLVVLLVFTGWGLYDALLAYPERGERHASWAEYQYLVAAREVDNNEVPGWFYRRASVTDPAAELDRLDAEPAATNNRQDAENPESNRHYEANAQIAREAWLTALQRIGELKPERTTIENPVERLRALDERWATDSVKPKPLAFYDIPSQYVIAVVCGSFAAYLAFLLGSNAVKAYRFDADTFALTLPSGETITPDDMAARLDKTKWDKFIVGLDVKPSHSTLGGRTIRFDTYRHAKLENWLLAMEEKAFGPEEQPEPALDEPAHPSDANVDAEDEPANTTDA